MTFLLPSEPGFSPEGRVLDVEPLDFWRPALEYLRDRHRLPAGTWQRFRAGKNAVFALDQSHIVKLVPPLWQINARLESTALELIHSRCGLVTPELLAVDELDGWTAIITGYVAGQSLHSLWPALLPAEKTLLAWQTGQLAARIHHLPPPYPEILVFDWQALLAEQTGTALSEVEGLAPAHLAGQLDDFLGQAGPLPDPTSPLVVLHGDLSFGNLLAQQQAGQWHLTGLVDLGDAVLGQAEHDFLSPNINNYHGDPRLLRAFFDGYGLPASKRTFELQQHLWSALYYGTAGARLRPWCRPASPTPGSKSRGLCGTWVISERYVVIS